MNWDSLGRHPEPGDTIEGYKLEAAVGAGGMASVYRARDAHGEVVALKILNPARVLPEERRRFTREYNALARMNHPNIVRVFKAGVHQGYPWIAMEFVDGCELEQLLEAWANESPKDRYKQVEHILAGLCRGLDYVHQTGLIHRDIKPTNILIRKDGTPKLSDFGVVKDPNSSSTQLTMAGRLVGTVAFMAPELIAAEEVDQRADLYALGAVLYILLTDKRPIEASSVAGYLARHLTEVPKAPSRLKPDVPKHLENICQRLLLKDPAHRYASANDILKALESSVSSGPIIRGQDVLTEQWRRRLTQLRDGAGGITLFHGPSRCGKSALLRHLCDVATGMGIRHFSPSAGEEPLLARLAKAFEVDENTPVSGILSTLGQKPAILAVDDIHLCSADDIDDISRIMKEVLTRKFLPVILILTSETIRGRVEPIVSGATTVVEPEILPIGPIDVTSAISVVKDLGVAGALSSVIGRRLHTDYFGSPGDIVEQVRTLVDEGWLEATPLGLKGRRGIEMFRSGPLPIPATRKQDVLEAIANLDVVQAELAEILALFDRPTRASLLVRSHTSPQDASQALEELHATKILTLTGEISLGEEEREELLYRFTNPYFTKVIQQHLAPEIKLRRHRKIAEALAGRRRRSASVELANHLIAGELFLQAYPVLINAARRASRAGNIQEVLAICEQALGIRNTCESALEFTETIRLRRWLFMIYGEAHLYRGNWEQAAEALERAVAAARIEMQGNGLGRCLSGLGRAYYRLDRQNESLRALEESLTVSESGAPERAEATRVLADISLQQGKLEQAEHLWNEALDYAISNQSNDGEARARRGIAHLRALQHRYLDASQLLDRAEEMLASSGDNAVRCGIIARGIELDLAAGRYASALHRSENLIQLSDRAELPARLSTALVLQAETFLKLGHHDRALHSVRQALLYSSAAQNHQWAIKMHCVRILLDLNAHDEADQALIPPESIPDDPLHTPAVQAAALRARIDAVFHPQAASDRAQWAFVQPKPPLHYRAAQIDLDIAKAYLGMGKGEKARKAAKSALKVLQVPGTDGLRLEVLLCLAETGQNDAMAAIYGQIAQKIYQSLPQRSAKTFASRPFIADVLSVTR